MKKFKGEQLASLIVVGSLVVLAQHFLAAEEESWLRRWRLWPI
jgi:hypothetical protein